MIRSEGRSSRELFAGYQTGGIDMPYTVADFDHDFVKEHLKELSLEERLESLSPEERLKGLSPRERLEGLSAEQIGQLLKDLQRGASARPRRPRRRK
jgi:hypothetical protein